MPPAALPTTVDVTARSLYLYENPGAHGWPAGGEALDQDDVLSRSLYLVVNEGAHGLPGQRVLNQNDIVARSLYLVVNVSHGRDITDVAVRSLYLYEAFTADEVFPWLMRISPTEQFPGGEVSVYGDGFGDTAAAEGGAVRLGVYDPAVPGPGVLMGVVSWVSRSPGLWPANGGAPIEPAIVVTVPAEAESGMLSIEETT